MALILNIDTATDTACISISKNGIVTGEIRNAQQKDHAAFLQPAIKDLAKITGTSLNELNAVAVVSGPGSYTGLRVGMASAKGLCYALKIPLITIGSLELLAASAISEMEKTTTERTALFCPMIDARRMEVFSAVYDFNLTPLSAPAALILEANSFDNWLAGNNVFFIGSGSSKWSEVCNHKNAFFLPFENTGDSMARISFTKFCEAQFSDLAYAEPLYLKEFYTTRNK